MTEERQRYSWQQRMWQNLPKRDFALGALIPVLVFYLFQRLDQPLTGALLAAGWGLGLSVISYWRRKRTNLFGVLATTLALVEVIAIVTTRNPDFYLLSAAIDSALYGLVFLGSLLLARPLVQILAEASGAGTASEQFRRSQRYRSAWQILTAVWGVIYLLKAVALVLFQKWLPLETFLILRTLSGFPLFALLMAFSYWFPTRYWRRT